MSLIAPPGSPRAFHLTRRDRLMSIERSGLRIDAPRLLTNWPSEDLVRAAYGCNPVFVSAQPWVERDAYRLLADYGDPADFVLLSVDISGLPLAADIACLAGRHDAVLEEDHLWFGTDEHPLSAWADRAGAIHYGALVGDPKLIAAANRWTGTMAVLASISPDRIGIAE